MSALEQKWIFVGTKSSLYRRASASFERTLTSQSHPGTAGAAAHLVGHPALVFTSIRGNELEDLQAHQLVLNEGFILPTTSQRGVVFEPSDLKGRCACHLGQQHDVVFLQHFNGLKFFGKVR